MRKTQHQYCTPQDVTCRRRATRIPMPVEVQFIMDGREVAAIIRDVSFNESGSLKIIGIGVLHHDFLPLDVPMSCRTDSDPEALPVKSNVTLMWTRHFGSQGYLSGGRMIPELVNSVDRSDLPRQA
jgi:hypothetical protein